MKIALLLALALVSFAAARLNGAALLSFDGSVALHRVETAELIGDTGKPLVLGPAARGSIVVLGYTRCTDECPLTLARVAAALAPVPRARRPRAYFVTVDPRHDSPAVLHAYLAPWRDRITGVTGEEGALRRLYAALGAANPGDRYREHDTRIFLLASDGVVERELDPDASPAEIAGALPVEP